MKLEFKVEKTINHPDGSREIYLDIEPACQFYIGYLLEGLDGYCYHTIVDTTTIIDNLPSGTEKMDQKQKLMKVTVTSDFYSTVMNFLYDVKGYEI